MEQCIYLNNSATSFPKPPQVLEAVAKLLVEPPLYSSRNSSLSSTQDLRNDCRQELAILFNAPYPEEIAFTSGATESLNLALKGLNLNGQHILTSSIEHNSVLRVLKTMEQDKLIRLTIIKSDSCGRITPSLIKENLQPDTLALVLNHCSNVTGTVNDLKEIGLLLKSKQVLFIVDASQSAGLYPIDIQSMSIDILAFTGHKALFGLQGIGGVYIKKGLAITPLKVGGTGSKSDLLYQPTDLPNYYEAGTANFTGIAALYEGTRFVRQIGVDFICKKIQSQITTIKKAFADYSDIKIYNPRNQNSTILSFTIEGIDSSDIGYLLEQNFNIIVRTGLHCAPLIHSCIHAPSDGTVRVSPSFFTTDSDIDLFIKAAKEILLLLKG
jgi:cysteine desulfurase family protein